MDSIPAHNDDGTLTEVGNYQITRMFDTVVMTESISGESISFPLGLAAPFAHALLGFALQGPYQSDGQPSAESNTVD